MRTPGTSRRGQDPLGRGALALKSIEKGYGAYFVRAYDLMEDLRKARSGHNLDRRLQVYLAPRNSAGKYVLERVI